MPEFDIDDLKSTWKSQPVTEKYGQREILQMLNRKSQNYVKYIFWISAAEFLIFLLMGIYYLFWDDADNSFMRILKKIGLQDTYELRMKFEHLYFLIKVIGLFVSGFFAIKFYLNYRKICVEENLRNLILRIIKFRRTVNLFILVNILLVIVFMAVLAGFSVEMMREQNLRLSNPTLYGFFTGIIVATILAMAVIWLYYKLVYGSIMKLLDSNLKQLQEMES